MWSQVDLHVSCCNMHCIRIGTSRLQRPIELVFSIKFRIFLSWQDLQWQLLLTTHIQEHLKTLNNDLFSLCAGN